MYVLLSIGGFKVFNLTGPNELITLLVISFASRFTIVAKHLDNCCDMQYRSCLFYRSTIASECFGLSKGKGIHQLSNPGL